MGPAKGAMATGCKKVSSKIARVNNFWSSFWIRVGTDRPAKVDIRLPSVPCVCLCVVSCDGVCFVCAAVVSLVFECLLCCVTCAISFVYVSQYARCFWAIMGPAKGALAPGYEKDPKAKVDQPLWEAICDLCWDTSGNKGRYDFCVAWFVHFSVCCHCVLVLVLLVFVYV